MSNRAGRRAKGGRYTPTKVHDPQPADVGPLVTVFVEKGAVVIQIAMGSSWVNQLTLPVEFAQQFYREYGDCLRELDTGLKIEHSKTGLYVP